MADGPADNTTDDDVTEDVQTDDEPDDTAETFPRPYVEKLRRESGGYRDRAKAAETRSDELAHQLFRMRVEATGKLADPDDLPFDADLLADDDKLHAAVDELLAKRPHYAKRTATGPVGQGVTGNKEQPFSLMNRLSQSV